LRGGDEGEGENFKQSPPPNLPPKGGGIFWETPQQSFEEFFD